MTTDNIITPKFKTTIDDQKRIDIALEIIKDVDYRLAYHPIYEYLERRYAEITTPPSEPPNGAVALPVPESDQDVA